MLRHTTASFVVVAIACAVIVMLPAPLPGHVVSSNDTVRAVPPYPGLGGRLLRNSELTDPAQVFRPDLRWARGVIRSGHLPVWDPFVFAGWPLLASQQAAPLFPVSALSYVLPYEASIAWRILVLLVLAMLGTSLFARRLGLGTVAAAVAALSFGLSAPLINFSSHPQLDVYALLPWLMLATDQVAGGRRGGVPLLAAAVGLAALGGHPQSLIVVAPLVIAWGMLRVVMQPGDVAAGCRRFALLGVAVALGLAAAAIVLVPLAELLGVASQTERGGFVGARLSALATLAVPDVWGRPSWGPVYANPLGLLNYVERDAYLGVLPVLLGVAGLFVRRDALRWFFAAGAGVSILLAFDVPGISSWLVGQWPLRLATMARATVVLGFCLAVLGGQGLQAIIDADARARRRAAAAAGVVALLPLVWVASRFHPLRGLDGAFALFPGAPRPVSGDEAVAAATTRWTLIAVASVIILALLALRPDWTRTLSLAAVSLLALDLVIGNRGLIPILPTDQARLGMRPAVAALHREQHDARVSAGAALGGTVPLVPNVGETLGLRDPRGRGVPVVRRTLDAWVAAGGAGSTNFAFVDLAAPRARVALRLFGVRALLTPPGIARPSGVDPLPVYDGPDGRVWRLRDPLPRAFVTCSWRPAPDRAASVGAILATTEATDLRHRPLVEGVKPPPSGCRTPARPAHIVHERPTRVDVDVRGYTEGRLVLLDTYYPGWTAAVDGRPAKIAATNVAFRSVAIPSAARRVTFAYRPGSVRAGTLISAVAWLVIALLAALSIGGGATERVSIS